ncbi:MAG: hypothetical protein KJ056_11770 [Acidimicrobiia bacterium]|nr:hypothetical protein [Acidimicrobiia bacterium]
MLAIGGRTRQIIDTGRWRWIFEPANRRVARIPSGPSPDVEFFDLAWEHYERAELRAGGRELVVFFDPKGRHRCRMLIEPAG